MKHETASVESAFRSLFVPMKLIGLWPVRSPRCALSATHHGYSAVLFAACLYTAVVRLGPFSASGDLTTTLLNVHLSWIHSFLIISHFTYASRRDQHLPALHRRIEEFWSCHVEEGRHEFARRSTRWLWLLVALFHAFYLCVFWLPGVFQEKEFISASMSSFSYPVHPNDTLPAALHSAFSISMSVISIEAWLFTLIHFILICVIFTKELHISNDRLAADCTGVNVETHRRRHDELCRLIADADRVLGFYVAVVFASFIPLLCVSIEDVVFGDLDILGRLAMSQWLLVQVLQIALISIFAIRLTHQAHKAAARLHSIDTNHLDFRELQQVNMFLNRLCGKSIGMSAWGMMVITKESLLAFIGTIVTYVVFVVQLHRM